MFYFVVVIFFSNATKSTQFRLVPSEVRKFVEKQIFTGNLTLAERERREIRMEK